MMASAANIGCWSEEGTKKPAHAAGLLWQRRAIRRILFTPSLSRGDHESTEYDDHLSGMCVTTHLKLPTCPASPLAGLRRGCLGLHRVGFAAIPRCRGTVGALTSQFHHRLILAVAGEAIGSVLSVALFGGRSPSKNRVQLGPLFFCRTRVHSRGFPETGNEIRAIWNKEHKHIGSNFSFLVSSLRFAGQALPATHLVRMNHGVRTFLTPVLGIPVSGIRILASGVWTAVARSPLRAQGYARRRFLSRGEGRGTVAAAP